MFKRAGSLTLLESGTRKVGLKIGVDHPMEENWGPVFAGSGGIFEHQAGGIWPCQEGICWSELC